MSLRRSSARIADTTASVDRKVSWRVSKGKEDIRAISNVGKGIAVGDKPFSSVFAGIFTYVVA